MPRPASSGSATTADFPVPGLVPGQASAAAPGWSVRGYQLERKLGEGGMGIVYRARRESDGATVALKTIAPAIAGTTGTIARFLREASVLRQLEHPNIVRFEQMGNADGCLYLRDGVRGGRQRRRPAQEARRAALDSRRRWH